MSLFGAISTAISGLNAQSTAFGNISDNVANSQTVGFKMVDTSFNDYLSTSTSTENQPGTVVAAPEYMNNVQGTISTSTDPLSMAIAGQGFFAVSQPTGTDARGNTVFAAQPYYSRAGDFQLNSSGYLVNSSGDYLNGWIANPLTGALNESQLQPIQVAQSVYKPVATQAITMAANLPAGATIDPASTSLPPSLIDASGAATASITAQVSVYDSGGTPHTVDLNWVPQVDATGTAIPNQWTVDAQMQGQNGTPATDLVSVDVVFGADGTLASLGAAAAGTTAGAPAAPVASTSTTAGDPATVVFGTNLPTASGATQSLTINFGAIGRTTGVTQFAANTFTLRSINQDGVPPGSFSSVTTSSSGNLYANYDNGQARLIARVPVATFGNPNALQRQNGSSFTATLASGNPSLQDAGSNGSGTLVTGSVEQSNVDIASEFSKLIVAQRAYSANAKMVTTADDMMLQTIDMKR
jgi:flagellar hook protein FlgE